jgi:hypothetical protein
VQHVDFGMNPQQAPDAPRMYGTPAHWSTWRTASATTCGRRWRSRSRPDARDDPRRHYGRADRGDDEDSGALLGGTEPRKTVWRSGTDQ